MATAGHRHAEPGRRGACSVQVLVELPGEFGGFAGGFADLDACGFECFFFGLGGAGGAGDDGAGVAHGFAFGGGEAGDVADHGFGDVVLDELGGAFFGVPADLTDHHDDLGVGVLGEGGQRVDVGGADDRVPTDPDRGGKPDIPQ